MAETTTKAVPKKSAAKTTTSRDSAIAKPTTKQATKAVAKNAAAATKPAVKKTGDSKKTTAAKVPAAKPVATQKKAMVVSDEQRYRMVAEAAYYRAESNQFKSDPLRDWIEAEKDIATLLSGN